MLYETSRSDLKWGLIKTFNLWFEIDLDIINDYIISL